MLYKFKTSDSWTGDRIFLFQSYYYFYFFIILFVSTTRVESGQVRGICEEIAMHKYMYNKYMQLIIINIYIINKHCNGDQAVLKL